MKPEATSGTYRVFDSLRLHFEQAPLSMIYVEGARHIVRYVNPAFCRLIDKPAEQLVGKPFSGLLPKHHGCLTMLGRVYRTGKSESQSEQQHSRLHAVFWSYTMWPVPGDEHHAGVMVQVTERALLHEKALAMNEALILGSVRQHELAEAAEAATALAREADVRKNDFLAMLAHELRNPLAPIRYMLEVMKRADGNGDLIKPALATIERQVRQMTRLIDDLLDVSRISRDKLRLRQEKVELASVIHDVVEAIRPACESAQFELTVTLPPQPVYLHADPARLAQVFGNLLSNACKFTRPGGRISLAAERQEREVVITVRDSGSGIAPDMLSKIFEMFTQADQTLERSQGGLGIGLTLVRRLVEMHGGSVQAFSGGADQGSEFVVRLPVLATKPEALSPEPPTAESPPITARRILVVDDNHDAADSLSILLSLSGNETYLAFDGEEAVAAAEKFRPDVILMDIGMPKLNGYGAARRIREHPWSKDMVLLALTGWGQDEDRKKTADAGFNGHLVKPVDYTALAKLLAGFPGAVRSG
jgi:signal transduction histidine kinase